MLHLAHNLLEQQHCIFDNVLPTAIFRVTTGNGGVVVDEAVAVAQQSMRETGLCMMGKRATCWPCSRWRKSIAFWKTCPGNATRNPSPPQTRNAAALPLGLPPQAHSANRAKVVSIRTAGKKDAMMRWRFVD